MNPSSFLVRRGLTTARQMEEALARQILYGGELLLALFELGEHDEAKVLAAASEELGLLATPSGALLTPAPEVIALLSAEQAQRFGVVPLALLDGALIVAASEPLGVERERELVALLGRQIEQRLALSFRLDALRNKVYLAPISRRVERLLHRLAGNTDIGVEEPLPASLPPRAVEATASVRNVMGLVHGESAERREHEKSRHRGPYTLDELLADLQRVPERGALFGLLFDFSKAYFDYTATFSVHGEALEVIAAQGEGARAASLRRSSLVAEPGGVLAAAMQRKAPYFGRAAETRADRELARQLERPSAVSVAVLPVIVRGRVVAVLYGDDDLEALSFDTCKDVVRAVEAAGHALERLLVKRKLRESSRPAAAVPAPSLPPIPAPSPPVVLPAPPPAIPSPSLPTAPLAPGASTTAAPPRRPADSVVDDLEVELDLDALPDLEELSTRDVEVPTMVRRSVAPLPPPVPPQVRGSSRPPQGVVPLAPPMTPPPRAVPPAPVTKPVLAPPSVEPETQPLPIAVEASPRVTTVRPLAPPIPREEPVSVRELPNASSLQASSMPRRRSTQEVEVWRPGDDLPAGPGAAEFEVWQPGAGAPVAAPRPVAPQAALPMIDVWQPGMPIPEEPAPESRAPQSVQAPHSRQAYSAAKAVAAPVSMRKPPTDEGLPSIILDVEIDHLDLVDRAIAGDAEAEMDLLRLGAKAMPALMARFPGPLSQQPGLEEALPRASECGPVVRIIARQRRIALGSILPFCQDADMQKRRFALLLLLELPYLDALEVAALAVADEDAVNRRIAAEVVRRLAREAPRPVVDRLVRTLRDVDVSPPKRIHYANALGGLEQTVAVPLILPVLGDSLAQVAESVRRALIRLTRHDFRLDTRKWQSWWTSNVGRHRIEWLIDATLQEDTGVRAEALEELSTLVGQPVILHESASPEQCETLHAQLTQWWYSTGQKKYAEEPV